MPSVPNGSSFLRALWLAFLLGLMAACGGGGGGGETPAPAAPTLVSIQITPAAVTQAAGLSQQYAAVGTFSDNSTANLTATVVWATSDASKVGITSTGLATARAAGAANVSASLNGVTSNASAFTVTAAALVSIEITPATVSKAAGFTQQYAATGTYTDGSAPDISGAVAWRSSDATKVDIGATGLATAVGVGSANVTAALDGVTSNASSFTVTRAVVVSISIDPPVTMLAAGLTQQFFANATFSDAAVEPIGATWRSSNPAVATISTTGVATGVAVGTTELTASQNGIASAPRVLTVTPADVASLQISPATATRAIGFGQRYSALGTFTDGSTRDVTAEAFWTSSDPTKAAFLDPRDSLVGAVAAGSASITARLRTKTSNAATLTVVGTLPVVATGAMTTARYIHTATLLPSGAVLVTGGSDNVTPVLASAELYDPAAGTWAPTGAMGSARQEHTATLLPNGKVLVTGGINGVGVGAVIQASSELYDPATGVWTPTGAMTTARHFHTATLLSTGQVLVVGGLGPSGFLASAELYDPATGAWTPTAPLLAGVRYTHAATLLRNGVVLISGGLTNSGHTATSEIYNPFTGLWSPTGAMATARNSHGAILLPDGKVLAAGGASGANSVAVSELYDPATGIWTATGPLNTARYGHSLTLLASQVLATGGVDSSTGLLSSSELFDPATGLWTPAAALITARSSHTATRLISGQVLVNGGDGLASSEVY